MTAVRIASVEAFAFRVPITAPIKVAFGTFGDRPGVRLPAFGASSASSA